MTVLSNQVRVLLREAKAAPDDDLPRLVLADWLQEQGDPRGELIAVQMQRHRLAADDPRQVELARRERLLLQRHIFDWIGPVIDRVSAWRFERGLIHLEARAEFLVRGWRTELMDTVLPWVEGARLTEVRLEHLTILRLLLLLDQLVVLDLSDNRLGDGVVLLTRSPCMKTLRWLDLRGNRIGDAGARGLAASPHLPDLWRLDLGGNPIPDEARAALVARFGDRVVLDG